MQLFNGILGEFYCWPSALPIRIPIGLTIGIQMSCALHSYLIECYLEGKKNQKENILCVGFVPADLG